MPGKIRARWPTRWWPGTLGLKFYAAAPLITKEGYNLGTFCVIDRKQRYLTESQKEILQRLARIVMDEMELRLAARNLLKVTSAHLRATVQEIEALPPASRTDSLMALAASAEKLIRQLQSQLQNTAALS